MKTWTDPLCPLRDFERFAVKSIGKSLPKSTAKAAVLGPFGYLLIAIETLSNGGEILDGYRKIVNSPFSELGGFKVVANPRNVGKSTLLAIQFFSGQLYLDLEVYALSEYLEKKKRGFNAAAQSDLQLIKSRLGRVFDVQ